MILYSTLDYQMQAPASRTAQTEKFHPGTDPERRASPLTPSDAQ